MTATDIGALCDPKIVPTLRTAVQFAKQSSNYPGKPHSALVALLPDDGNVKIVAYGNAATATIHVGGTLTAPVVTTASVLGCAVTGLKTDHLPVSTAGDGFLLGDRFVDHRYSIPADPLATRLAESDPVLAATVSGRALADAASYAACGFTAGAGVPDGLQQVQVDVEDERVLLTGTDRFRVHTGVAEVACTFRDDAGGLDGLPLPVAALLPKLLPAGDVRATVYRRASDDGEQTVVVDGAGVQVQASLQPGGGVRRFAYLTTPMEPEQPTEATVDAVALRKAIRAVAAPGGMPLRGVTVRACGATVTVTAVRLVGADEGPVANVAATVEGPDGREVLVNPDYLHKATVGLKTVRLGLHGPATPVAVNSDRTWAQVMGIRPA